jgi:hypothetical protein
VGYLSVLPASRNGQLIEDLVMLPDTISTYGFSGSTGNALYGTRSFNITKKGVATRRCSRR